MSVLRAWFHRSCNLFRKERLDRELDTELASHLEMHIEDKPRAGLTPEEARRVAFIKRGGFEQTKRESSHHKPRVLTPSRVLARVFLVSTHSFEDYPANLPSCGNPSRPKTCPIALLLHFSQLF
jgi:hypothetical protein